MKRILLVNEFSGLHTGYSICGLEIMKRLHATGKFLLAEHAAYCPQGINLDDYPWKVYSNMYRNSEEEQAYRSRPSSQFGEFRFEETCIDFRPDIVWGFTDPWQHEFEARSPFRPYYHWAIMPALDSEPVGEQWLSMYQGADAVFSYSDYGLGLLKKQAGGLINAVGTASPGADLKNFKPLENKVEIKQAMGLRPDSLVVGTVMRNQKRKLYPALVEAFGKFLREGPKEITSKTFLYLHTSVFDIGWPIAKLIKEAGIGHRTLFTYVCQRCKAAFPSLFADARAICKSCGAPAACFPNSTQGVPTSILGKVMGIFDVYVQYANCEALGIPQLEAAACGVPVMATDYAAMSTVVRKLKGYPIKVKCFSRESETDTLKAVPDNDDFIEQLTAFLSLPASLRRKKGFDARQAVEKHFSWENAAKAWEDHFDSVEVKPHEQTWLSPAKTHTPQQPNEQVARMGNPEFVAWGLAYVAGRPDLVNSFIASRMLRDLNYQFAVGGMTGLILNENSQFGSQMGGRPFSREDAYNEFLAIAQHTNTWEQRRGAVLPTKKS